MSVERNYDLAKNFSVAWLSQSSQPDYRSRLQAAVVHSPTTALQTKRTAHIGSLLTEDNVKDVTKIPSSPTSKYSSLILKSLVIQVLKT